MFFFFSAVYRSSPWLPLLPHLYPSPPPRCTPHWLPLWLLEWAQPASHPGGSGRCGVGPGYPWGLRRPSSLLGSGLLRPSFPESCPQQNVKGTALPKASPPPRGPLTSVMGNGGGDKGLDPLPRSWSLWRASPASELPMGSLKTLTEPPVSLTPPLPILVSLTPPRVDTGGTPE